MRNELQMLIGKYLINGYPDPMGNFVWFNFLLLLIFLFLFVMNTSKKLKYNVKPIIFYIPILTFLISYIGAAYGGILALDAISNVPSAQRFQAISTGISVSISSMFLPGMLILFEAFLCIIIITIDKNKKK